MKLGREPNDLSALLALMASPHSPARRRAVSSTKPSKIVSALRAMRRAFRSPMCARAALQNDGVVVAKFRRRTEQCDGHKLALRIACAVTCLRSANRP